MEPIRPEIARTVGARIRALRTDANLTVVSLSERSGVSRRMLTQIEQGQANPSLATIDRIAAALDTTFPALVGVVDEPGADGVPVWSTPRGSRGVLLQAIETASSFVELWEWHLVFGDTYVSAAAPQAPDTMIRVTHGTLRVSSDGLGEPIIIDRAARISAQTPQSLSSLAASTTFIWVVTLPRRPS